MRLKGSDQWTLVGSRRVERPLARRRPSCLEKWLSPNKVGTCTAQQLQRHVRPVGESSTAATTRVVRSAAQSNQRYCIAVMSCNDMRSLILLQNVKHFSGLRKLPDCQAYACQQAPAKGSLSAVRKYSHKALPGVLVTSQ